MPDKSDNDPLARLLIDADEVDRVALSDALKGLISIDVKSGRPVPSGDYNRLRSRKKVLAVLLARKAAHLLAIVDSETLANRDVVQQSGLPLGTAAPALKELREGRYVAQDETKAYFV